MEMFPLLIIAFTWVFVAIIVSVVKKSAKNTSQKRGTRRGPAQAAPEPVSDPEHAAALSSAPRAAAAYPAASPFRHDDSLYKGSLNAETGEGYDPCHDEQMAPLTLLETEPETLSVISAPPGVPGLRLSWTSDAIVQGVVMSEILNRKHS
ncbi:MAG: hypothetical protein J6U01_07655 [Clostridia bacterium]|nr:hypothetical protein [Clostridia bacterium]